MPREEQMMVNERRKYLKLVYDNDSYNFGPFVPLMHLLPSTVTLPLQRVSSGERLSFCASSLVWPISVILTKRYDVPYN